jgi:hypothetical protein
MRQLLLVRTAISWVLAPLVGLGTLVYLLVTKSLQAWHLPLIAGLVFGPAVAWDSLRDKVVKVGDALREDDPK